MTVPYIVICAAVVIDAALTIASRILLKKANEALAEARVERAFTAALIKSFNKGKPS